MLSSGEIAKEFGVSRQTVNDWVHNGWIRPHVLTGGRHMRFLLEEVRQQLRERAADAKAGDIGDEPTVPPYEPLRREPPPDVDPASFERYGRED